jgi:hypothetical protein
VPHISLVFREMWDTTSLHRQPLETWAEKDGAQPLQRFHSTGEAEWAQVFLIAAQAARG